MGLASSPRIFTEFMSIPMWAIRNAHRAIYYVKVPEKRVLIQHFKVLNDLEFMSRTKEWIIPLLAMYVDDILGIHPTPEGANQQWLHSESVLKNFL